MAQNNTISGKEPPKAKADRLLELASDQIESVLAKAEGDGGFFGSINVKVQIIAGQVEYVAVTEERTHK